MTHLETRYRSASQRWWLLAAALAPVLILPACGGSGNEAEIAVVEVAAASGATVVLPGNRLTVTIPAGALDKDTTVTVTRLSDASTALPVNMVANGGTYAVAFSNDAKLSSAMSLKASVEAVPQHPQLGEIATLVGDTWQRVPANFFRASDRTVLALAMQPATFRVVNRSLQKTDGASVASGRQVFLEETFGNEAFFGAIGLHTVLNSVAPADAVALGAQVDLAKVPQAIAAVLTGNDNAAKDAALKDAAVTRALIKAGAVVGVKGVFGDAANPNVMTAAGITCALCHVNVKPTTFQLSSGPTPLPIGPLQIDGVPNFRMDAGKILALTPGVRGIAGASAVLAGWGPGRFDIRALPDNPLDDGVDNPTKYPPLWNFIDLEQQNYAYDWDGLFRASEGVRGTPQDDSLASQAEAVYDLVMHANGAFGNANGNLAPQLRAAPPQALVEALVAAETGALGNDIVTQKLRDVQAFQRSIVSPAPGQFDEALAQQGFLLFNGKARCSGCHSTAEFTGRPIRQITATPLTGGLAGGIKTTGLRGVSKVAPYFHDGSAATLLDAVRVYVDRGIVPALTGSEQAAIAEYLKSL